MATHRDASSSRIILDVPTKDAVTNRHLADDVGDAERSVIETLLERARLDPSRFGWGPSILIEPDANGSTMAQFTCVQLDCAVRVVDGTSSICLAILKIASDENYVAIYGCSGSGALWLT
jgi:hypothetical protein